MPPRKTPSKDNSNVTKKNSKNDATHADDTSTLLEHMPLARAVLNRDLKELATLIHESLPNKQQIQSVEVVSLEQSVGEAFTGGRSTPVYHVQTKLLFSKNNGVEKERSFIIKLVDMRTSDSSGDSNNPKLQMKRESYAVERRFYKTVAPALTKDHALTVPKLLLSDHDGKHPYDIACWLMNDVRTQYPLHPTVLSAATHMKAALQWLAKFHAIHWNQLQPQTSSSSSTMTNSGDWRRDLWDRGGFWTKEYSSGGISNSWLQTCQWISKNQQNVCTVTSTTKSLSTRLLGLRQPLIHYMKKIAASSSWSTCLHGDYKAANLFFTSNVEDTTTETEIDQRCVAVVDFQFAGAGTPAEDFAYVLFPDAFCDYWSEEEELLQLYYDHFIQALINSNVGGPSSLPYDVFLRLYRLSQLELTMYWLSKGWVASTPGDAKLVSVLEQTVDEIDGGTALRNLNEYNDALERFTNKGL